MSKYLDSYLQFLNNSFSEIQLENRVEITIPLLDRHSEPLHVYIEKENDDIYLTDDGYIIEDLLSSGCNVKTSARNMLLHGIARNYKIDISDDYELYTYTTLDSFDQRLHSLILCMLAVSVLHLTLKENNASIFLDDIKDYFDLK